MQEVKKSPNHFLVCPKCLNISFSHAQGMHYVCDTCHYEWQPLLPSLQKCYFVSFDEILVSLIAADGEEYTISSFPATIGRNSDFKALQNDLAVSRKHCILNYDEQKKTFTVKNCLGVQGRTRLNNSVLEPEKEYPFSPADDLFLSGVKIRLKCCLNKEKKSKYFNENPSWGRIELKSSNDMLYLCLDTSNKIIVSTDNKFSNQIGVLFHNKTNWNFIAVDRSSLRLDGYVFIEKELKGGETLQIKGRSFIFNSTNNVFTPVANDTSVGIHIQSMSAGYKNKVVLEDISCHIPKGKLTAILGESGCGKSTLIKILSGQKSPIAGNIKIDNDAEEDYSAWARHSLALVPQDNIVHEELTVRQCIEFAADIRIKERIGDSTKQTICNKIINDTGLEECKNRFISEISGGQKKRVNIAVELTNSPDILLLDEPTTGLDSATEQQIIEILRRMTLQGKTVVFVTHSLTTIKQADHVIILQKKGEQGTHVLSEGSPQEVKEENDVSSLDELYTHMERENPENKAVKKEKRLAFRPTGIFASFCRYLMIWINTPASSSLLLFGLPILLGILIRIAAAHDEPRGADRLLFALIAMFWMGMNQSVREIVKERHIFIQENAKHVSSRTYLLSKLMFFAIISYFQACLIAIPIAWLNIDVYVWEIKYDQLTCTMTNIIPMFWFAGFTGCVIGLFFSAVSLFIKKEKAEIAAVLFAVIATLPQFLFSDKVIPQGLTKKAEHFFNFICWHESAQLSEICSYFTFSRYLFLPLDAISRFLEDKNSVITKTFIFNCGILTITIICFIIITWVLLELFAFHSSSTKK